MRREQVSVGQKTISARLNKVVSNNKEGRKRRAGIFEKNDVMPKDDSRNVQGRLRRLSEAATSDEDVKMPDDPKASEKRRCIE